MVDLIKQNKYPPILAQANLFGEEIDSSDESAPYGPGIKEDFGPSRSNYRREFGKSCVEDSKNNTTSRFCVEQSTMASAIKSDQIISLMESGRELINRLPSDAVSKVIKALDTPSSSHLADAILGQLHHEEIQTLNPEHDAGETEFVAFPQSQRTYTPVQKSKESDFVREFRDDGEESINRGTKCKVLQGSSQEASKQAVSANESIEQFSSDQRRTSDSLSTRKAAALGHNARKKDLVRFRWTLAIWYATEESQRLKSQRRGTELNLQAVQRAGQEYVMFRRASSGAANRRNSFRSQSSTADDETSEGREFGASTLIRPSFVSRDRFKSTESHLSSQKGSFCSVQETKSSWHLVHKIVILTSSLYTLYMVDLYVIATEQMPLFCDILIYSINVLCFFIFILDLLHGLLTIPNFRKTMYMWLELLAIFSMIPDVCVLIFLVVDTNHQLPSRFTNLLRLVRLGKFIGQAARTGATKSSRIIFAFQQVHSLASTICKLFKQVKNKVECEQNQDDIDADSVIISDQEILRSRGSYLGKSSIGHDLDHTVSKYQTIMVSLILILGECTASMIACDKQAQAELNLLLLEVAAANCNIAHCKINPFEGFLQRSYESGQKILFFNILGNLTYGNESLAKSYRTYPYPEVTVASMLSNFTGTTDSVIHLLNRESVVLQCWSSVITTTVVLIFLTLLTTSLAGTIHKTVIVPLQRMVATVLALEADPLRPLKREPNHQSQKIHEVTLIENALLKIASLLQLGFGEAGANIIQETMKQGNSVALKTDVGGKVVFAIYGFCDIRNFTDCTEVLQGDVVKLVNEVAAIVHGAVVENLGAPNKNIGDAFLIAQSKKLERWANKTEIQKRIPGYQVRMGYGLHFGWSIEGAIGSMHKIDASYLSPHVNMASRLEAATKQYGVDILFSEDFFGLLAPKIQELCRKIDCVTVKGSRKPTRLYTYDVPVTRARDGTQKHFMHSSISSHSDETAIEESLEYFFDKVVPPCTDDGFRNLWSFAMDMYLGGPNGEDADWLSAKKVFKVLLAQRPDDGPVRTILDVIRRLQDPDGNAPKEWSGHRSLEEK